MQVTGPRSIGARVIRVDMVAGPAQPAESVTTKTATFAMIGRKTRLDTEWR
jgi:hypothetical protein